LRYESRTGSGDVLKIGKIQEVSDEELRGFLSYEEARNPPRMLGTIRFPHRHRGRQTPESIARYDADLAAFCEWILQINSSLDFKVGSRGWCYILEPHGLMKGDFDEAQRLINDCRCSGALPLDICAEDSARQSENLEVLDDDDLESEAEAAVSYVRNYARHAADSWNPISFWDYQDVLRGNAVVDGDAIGKIEEIVEGG
jgi:hypothetical protein